MTGRRIKITGYRLKAGKLVPDYRHLPGMHPVKPAGGLPSR